MDASTPDRGQPAVDPVPIVRPRRGSSPLPSELARDVRGFGRGVLAGDPVLPPDQLEVTVGALRPLVPSQHSQLPSTVPRAPRLWSILYDGLSTRDQRWVLDTIARYRQA